MQANKKYRISDIGNGDIYIKFLSGDGESYHIAEASKVVNLRSKELIKKMVDAEIPFNVFQSHNDYCVTIDKEFIKENIVVSDFMDKVFARFEKLAKGQDMPIKEFIGHSMSYLEGNMEDFIETEIKEWPIKKELL